MKKCKYIPFSTGLLALCVCLTPPRAAAQNLGRRTENQFAVTNIMITSKAVQTQGFVLEKMVSTESLRRAIQEQVYALYQRLEASGNRRAALNLFSGTGGVLANYDTETPDVRAVLRELPSETKTADLLQLAFSELCDRKDRVADQTWIPLIVNKKLDVEADMPTPPAQVILLPGRHLWKAPGYAAERIENRSGPLMLYLYATRTTERGDFYEAGSSPLPADSPYIAFLREEDALLWPAYHYRLRYAGNESPTQPTTVETWTMSKQEASRSGTCLLSKEAVYPLISSERNTDTTVLLTIQIIQAPTASLLKTYPGLPFAILKESTTP